MFTMQLHDERVKLVKPDVQRDAPLGVQWLTGEQGRQTLRLMGVTDAHNQPSELKQEQRRVQDFLERHDQLNWMIEVDGRVVGGIWVELESTEYIHAPIISIMLGDPSVRGKGVGTRAMNLVINYLRQQGYFAIYARHLVANHVSRIMNEKLGLVPDGMPYVDADGLEWQNVMRKFEE